MAPCVHQVNRKRTGCRSNSIPSILRILEAIDAHRHMRNAIWVERFERDAGLRRPIEAVRCRWRERSSDGRRRRVLACRRSGTVVRRPGPGEETRGRYEMLPAGGAAGSARSVRAVRRCSGTGALQDRIAPVTRTQSSPMRKISSSSDSSSAPRTAPETASTMTSIVLPLV